MKRKKNQGRLGTCKHFLIVLAVGCSLLVNAQQGSLKGKVLDAATKEPLIGAAVQVTGRSVGAATDLDGFFTIPTLPAGTYTLQVTYISYNPLTHPDVVVEAGKETEVELLLTAADISLGAVEVLAKVNRMHFATLLNDQKVALAIQENVGANQLSIQGVSDAATATTKVAGVTKSEGSGDVFVRGLGDRYLSTTMNGLPIPSDNVDKKNIDLGLIETSVIQYIGINKAYTPDQFADQAAGNINLVSAEYSERRQFSLQGGINTAVMDQGAWASFNASPVTTGSLLTFMPEPENLRTALTNQSWQPRTRTFPLDGGLSTLGGAMFNLHDRPLTLFYALSYKQEQAYTKGVYRKYVDNLLQNAFEDAETWLSTQRLTGLLTFHYRVNPALEWTFNNLLIRKLSDQVYEQGRNGQGYVRDSGEPTDDHIFDRDQSVKETQVWVNQLLGRYALNEQNKLEWALGYNRVDADEPNRIRNRVGVTDNKVVVNMHGIGNFDNRRSSQELVDHELNGFVKNNWQMSLFGTGLSSTLGLNVRYKTRDFSSNFVGADIKDLPTLGIGIDNLTDLFTQAAFTPTLIKAMPRDTYQAYLLVAGAHYALAYQAGALTLQAGFRVENQQIGLQWDVNNDQYPGVENRVTNNLGLYPSLNLKLSPTDDQNIRLSLSRTLTLPEFKELAPFPYVSPTGNITKGNPDLKPSRNDNLDLKWERFTARDEVYSLTSFFKYIKDPINLTMERGAARSFLTANTGSHATVIGLEAELRKNLYQSPRHVVRFIGNATGWMGSVSANYSSDRLFALGHPLSASHPDTYFNESIVEKGFVTLDAVLSKALTDKWSLKLTGRNLLNPLIQQTQQVVDYTGGITQPIVESYQNGFKAQLSVTYQLN